jgi:hypothetical protein
MERKSFEDTAPTPEQLSQLADTLESLLTSKDTEMHAGNKAIERLIELLREGNVESAKQHCSEKAVPLNPSSEENAAIIGEIIRVLYCGDTSASPWPDGYHGESSAQPN